MAERLGACTIRGNPLTLIGPKLRPGLEDLLVSPIWQEE